MTIYCPFCGTLVKKLDGKDYCPNCGFVNLEDLLNSDTTNRERNNSL